MGIFIGTSTANQKEISIGASQIGEVYVGSDLVWRKSSLPVFDGISDIIVQPDGKILVTMIKYYVYEDSKPNPVRLNIDGTVDSTFVTGNMFLSTPSPVLQPDGKIIGFTPLSGLTRLLPNGVVDPTFSCPDSMSTGGLSNIRVLQDGKILVVRNRSPRISKYNADGSKDPGFDVTSFIPEGNTVNSIEQQDDGKILIGGNFTGYIKRFDPDGTWDSSFNADSSVVNKHVLDMIVRPDGKIVVRGLFTNFIALLNPDGSADNSFNGGLSGITKGIYGMAVQPDNKILIRIDTPKRLHIDGSVDSSFNMVFPDNITGLPQNPGGHRFMQSDGKFLFGADYLGSPSIVFRTNPNGSLDTSFKYLLKP